MSFENERSLIEARFESEWGTTTSIAWDNVPFDPPDEETSFVRLTIIDGTAAYSALGGSEVRATGIIDIGIFTPENGGTRPGRLLADQAAAVFRGWSSGKLTCRAPYITRVGLTHGRFLYTVTVPFIRDENF